MLTPQGFTEQTTDAATTTTSNQLVPHSIEAEQALLGALVIDPSQMLEVGYLTAKDFYLLNHGYLYDAMKALFEKHGDYDYVTVVEHLDSSGRLEDIGGAGGLAQLTNTTPTSYGAPEYAAIIYRHSIGRQVIDRCMKITQDAYQNVTARSGDMLVSKAIQRFGEIDATRNISNGPQEITNGVERLLDRMEEIEQSGHSLGLKTGIKTLDFILGGFGDRKFYLLAGRPGMGKSGLALQIAHNIAKRGIGVLIFALEMTSDDIAARLTSSICDVPYESFNRGNVGDNWQCILSAGEQVARLPLVVDDTPALTVANIRSIAQKTILSRPIGLIIIDHVGIARPERSGGNSYQIASDKADSFMALPKQLGCPVLALSQLSRKVEEGNDKHPQMHHLRDSGKWEENADGILFLYRDEVYNTDTEFPHMGEIHVSKNRGGKRGVATIYANVALNKFFDLEIRNVPL